MSRMKSREHPRQGAKYIIQSAPQELLRVYVQEQKFTSTANILEAMKEILRDVIQQVIEVEVELEPDSCPDVHLFYRAHA